MKVAIIGLGFRLGYLGRVFKEIDPSFEIVGYVDPARRYGNAQRAWYLCRQGL